jgi:hypothetical protein
MTYVDWFNHRRLHGEITNDTRLHHPSRPVRSHLLQSDHLRRTGEDTNHRASMKPGALQKCNIWGRRFPAWMTAWSEKGTAVGLFSKRPAP